MTNTAICTTSHPGIASGVKLGTGVKIAPDAFIAAGSEIGDNVTIEPGVVIYENVKLGANTYVGAQCILGERVLGFLTDPNYKNPDLVIGANSTLRSAALFMPVAPWARNFKPAIEPVFVNIVILEKIVPLAPCRNQMDK